MTQRNYSNILANYTLTSPFSPSRKNPKTGKWQPHNGVDLAATAGTARTICLNETTQLGAAVVTGSSYQWSSVPAGFSSTLANPTVAPLVTTTYTVVETNPSMVCTNSNSVVVSLNPAPAAVAGTPTSICLNESTTLGATAVAGSTYSWSSSPSGFSSTSANPTVSPLVTTTYTVVETITATAWPRAASCTTSATPVITAARWRCRRCGRARSSMSKALARDPTAARTARPPSRQPSRRSAPPGAGWCSCPMGSTSSPRG